MVTDSAFRWTRLLTRWCIDLWSLRLWTLVPPNKLFLPISKNLVNITNDNFVPVQIVGFSVQGVLAKVVVSKTKISNMSSIQSRSQNSVRNVHVGVSLPLPASDQFLCCSTPSKWTCQSQTRIWGEFGFDFCSFQLWSHVHVFSFLSSFIRSQFLLPIQKHQDSHPVSGTAVSVN